MHKTVALSILAVISCHGSSVAGVIQFPLVEPPEVSEAKLAPHRDERFAPPRQPILAPVLFDQKGAKKALRRHTTPNGDSQEVRSVASGVAPGTATSRPSEKEVPDVASVEWIHPLCELPESALLEDTVDPIAFGSISWHIGLAAFALLALCIAWVINGTIRIRVGDCVLLSHLSGNEEVLWGPRLSFRPWPLFKAKRFDAGPHECQVNRVASLTADGFRPEISIFILYSISGPRAISARRDSELAIQTLAASSVSQLAGELNLATLVSRQSQVGDRVVDSIQKNLNGWGINIHCVEITRIGRVGVSNARFAFASPEEQSVSSHVNVLGAVG